MIFSTKVTLINNWKTSFLRVQNYHYSSIPCVSSPLTFTTPGLLLLTELVLTEHPKFEKREIPYILQVYISDFAEPFYGQHVYFCARERTYNHVNIFADSKLQVYLTQWSSSIRMILRDMFLDDYFWSYLIFVDRSIRNIRLIQICKQYCEYFISNHARLY
jgi:hypothetical protein